MQFAPLYICAGGLLLLLLWTVIGLLLPPGTSKLWGQLLAYGLFTISAITPAFAMAKLEDRRFGDYGLPGKTAFGPRFWAGCIAGLLALSLLVVGLDWLGCLKVEGVALHGLRTLKFALFWGLFFLLVALWEEFAFRGYLLFALARAIGFWPAAVISSLVFGYTHRSNAGETWVGALGAAAIGFFFCLTRRRTGNLWFAVGLHASWDWAQSFLYGVPDSGTVEPGHLLKSGLQGPPWLSGGPAGPEGSVLLFALLAVMWVAFDRLYPSAPEAAAGAGKTDPLKPMGDPQPATKNSEPCR
ncbi:MAG: CPBP family intramembrane metalloprotease [Acidobacteria bacterium]|nr:CPBP family intramembrane metalloprotease [Acidobacteriota bacterium]